MTIQEYIKISISGKPAKDVVYYRPYFKDMDCKWCIYNGYACTKPKKGNVCIDYRVERTHLEFKQTEECISPLDIQ